MLFNTGQICHRYRVFDCQVHVPYGQGRVEEAFWGHTSFCSVFSLLLSLYWDRSQLLWGYSLNSLNATGLCENQANLEACHHFDAAFGTGSLV